MVTGSTLQEDIDRTARQLLAKGRDILGLIDLEKSLTTALPHDSQTAPAGGSAPPNSRQFQLG
jgi:hypothetical protein